MEIEAQKIAKENFETWTIDPAYEIVPDRGIPRLVKYKKDFSEDVMVRCDGAPLIMKASGKALRACDVMPERADIALDKDGNLLDQGQFHQRYQEWLSAFAYPEGHNIADDPVPNVARYVSEIQDTFSESSGWIEQYFDPKLNQEWEPAERFDTEGRTPEERLAAESNTMTGKLMEALVSKLSPEQAVELIQEVSKNEIPIVKVDSDEQEVSATAEEPPVPEKPEKEILVAPCGKACKGKAGLKAHKRFCGDERCGEGSENSTRNEDAA